MVRFFLSLSRIQKQCIAALTDMTALPLIFLVAVWLRFDGLTADLLHQFFPILFIIPLIAIPIFIKIGLYRAVIRFVDHKIVYTVLFGMTVTLLVLVGIAVYFKIGILSRAVYSVFWICAVMYMMGSRFVARAMLVEMGSNHQATRVAIYGAGSTGMQLANAFMSSREYAPMFLIDDKEEIQGATIAGLTVYSSDNLAELIEKFHVQEIHLVMPSIAKKTQRKILQKLEPLHVKVRITPPIRDLLNGQLTLKDIREIEIEDLLGRDPVEPNQALISACVTNKTVMVSGAGGSIGSELCRQILGLQPKRLILLEMSEFALYQIERELNTLMARIGSSTAILPFLGSVLDTNKCKKIMMTFQVDTVYHAAAYKHVPLVEQNPIDGIRNNVFGTLSIAKAAVECKVPNFVLISTDKAVRPTNVMGSTKRLSELILQGLADVQNSTRFCMVRFGNVLGSSGSVVPLFRAQIKAGGPITLTHPEITRYFMTIPEAAQLVLQAGSMGLGGDVFVLDMGEPVKILDLAQRMIRLSGLPLKSESNDSKAIGIEHVGLRPGEKLYEELLIGNNVNGTEHPLIMRATEHKIAWQELEQVLEKLNQACLQFDYQEVRKLLLEAVNEYQPQCGIEDMIWAESTRQAGQHNLMSTTRTLH